MNPNSRGSALSPVAPSGSPSAGAAAVDPMSRLLQMQDVMAGGEQATNEESPVTATEAVPAGGERPAAAAPGEVEAGDPVDEAGQTDLSNSEEAGETPAVPGEDETPEGATPEGAAELAELPEDVRAELLNMAREVAEGKTSFGELKRGHKLIGKHAEEVDRLTQENEGLKQKLAKASEGGGQRAEAGTGLKSVAEVREREVRLQKVIDWCEDHPQGGDQNGQEFTAEEVTQMRRDARDELKYVLPARREQLQQQEQSQAAFTQQQQQARGEVLKHFPALRDPEHVETKAVKKMLKEVPMLNSMFISPELAALTWLRGEAALKAEMAKRAPAARTPQRGVPTKPGVVAAKRPASGGGTAAPARAGGTSVAAAKERIANERSVGALAGLMSAMENK